MEDVRETIGVSIFSIWSTLASTNKTKFIWIQSHVPAGKKETLLPMLVILGIYHQLANNVKRYKKKGLIDLKGRNCPWKKKIVRLSNFFFLTYMFTINKKVESHISYYALPFFAVVSVQLRACVTEKEKSFFLRLRFRNYYIDNGPQQKEKEKMNEIYNLNSLLDQ